MVKYFCITTSNDGGWLLKNIKVSMEQGMFEKIRFENEFLVWI